MKSRVETGWKIDRRNPASNRMVATSRSSQKNGFSTSRKWSASRSVRSFGKYWFRKCPRVACVEGSSHPPIIFGNAAVKNMKPMKRESSVSGHPCSVYESFVQGLSPPGACLDLFRLSIDHVAPQLLQANTTR